MMSSEKGSYSCSDYLIRKGANVRQKNAKQQDALFFAKQSGKKDVIDLVKKAWDKADVAANAIIFRKRQELLKFLTPEEIEKAIIDFKHEINFKGFENIELASIAPEIGFRDSRRIEGKYTLTHEDIENSVVFEDTVCVFPRMYDMLSPDGFMGGDGALSGMGNKGHIFVHIKEDDTRTFGVPYRCLLPARTSNLLVAGRCISTTHVAESSVRAIYACMLTGQAAGTAAAIASASSQRPEQVDTGSLRGDLARQGIVIS
jgi:hypothetical protein